MILIFFRASGAPNTIKMSLENLFYNDDFENFRLENPLYKGDFEKCSRLWRSPIQYDEL